MSLFEKLNNKRYDLQEASSGGKSKSGGSGSSNSANKTSNNEINKRLSASTTKGDQARSQYGTDGGYGDSNVGDATQNKSPYKQPTKKQVRDIQNKSTINKLKKGQMPNISSSKITGDVTSTITQKAPDAKTITKKYNQKNPNRKEFKKFFDPEKAKIAKDNLIAKRKEYGIDPEGKTAADAGIERYATKTKQLASGSNVPVEITQADKDLAKKRMLGDPEDPTTGTGKYGGRVSPKASEKEMKQTMAYLKKRGLTKGFTGDKPQTKDDVKPQKDRVTVNTTDTDKVATPKPESKKGVFSTINKFTKNNPVTALATYDMGKGILGKIMKARIPNVPTPRAIRVSAKS